MKNKKVAIVCSMISLAVFSGRAFGQQLELAQTGDVSTQANVFVDARFTNNVRKADRDKESDVAETVGIRLLLNKTTPLLSAQGQYQLRNTGYKDGSFSNEVWLSGSSSVIISATPDRYGWFLGHQQSESSVDSMAADTPNNRDERSAFTTGPNLNLRLSPVDSLQMQLRRIETRFGESNENESTRDTGSMSIVHSFRRGHRISLNGNYSDVAFDKREDNDYKQSSVGLALLGGYRYGEYSLESGRQEIERAGEKATTGVYSRVSVGLNTDNGLWRFNYNDEVTDSSIGLSLNHSGLAYFSQNESGGDGNFGEVDIIDRQRIQLSYARSALASRIDWRFSLMKDDQDYEILPQDQRSWRFNAAMNYSLASNLKLGFNYIYKRIDYMDNSLLEEDELEIYRLDVNHNLNEELSIRYGLAHEVKTNDANAVGEYEEQSILISLTYRIK